MQIRRRYARWHVGWQARIKLEGAVESADCFITDMSFKGMQFSCAFELPADKFINLSLMLSEELVLDLEAWVVWHKAVEGINLHGVYFTRIRDKDKENIYRFIQRNYPREIVKKWWQEPEKEEGGEKMDDRRTFERFAVNFPLNFLNLNNGREGVAQGNDISAKGVGFTTDEELQPRTPLELWLQIPDKADPLYARAEVAWCKKLEDKKCRIGVCLENANFMGLSRILRSTKTLTAA